MIPLGIWARLEFLGRFDLEAAGFKQVLLGYLQKVNTDLGSAIIC